MKLPPPIKLKKRGSNILFEDGVPEVLELRRLHGIDQSIRATAQNECCDCGLTHVHDYEVRQEGKLWLLIVRSYRVEK